MEEKYRVLLSKILRLEMLMHRYQGYGFRAFGPSANPIRGQGRILSILRMKPCISQKELSFLLDMRQQSLSELLAKLEGKGLITRSPLDEDRRVTMISLTDEGRKAAEELDDSEFSAGDIFDCMTKEEQEQFERYVDRLSDAVERKLEGFGRSDARREWADDREWGHGRHRDGREWHGDAGFCWDPQRRHFHGRPFGDARPYGGTGDHRTDDPDEKE